MKKKPTKCRNCRRDRQKHRTLCSPCIYEQKKARDLLAVRFVEQRQNARRRNKPFRISLEYYRQFAYEVDLLVGRGRTAKSFQVDCIVEALGYVEGNLQKLTCSENVQKENARRRKVLSYDVEARTGRYHDVSSGTADADDDCPF